MKNQRAYIAMNAAHKCLKDAMKHLNYAVSNTKDDEFANPIVIGINEHLLNLMKELTIAETYGMFAECGLDDPKYDGIFEQMWTLYKASKAK